MDQETITISSIEVNEGCKFEVRCPACGKEIVTGRFGVLVSMGIQEYLLCDTQKKNCCGDGQHVPLLFDSEAAVKVATRKAISSARKNNEVPLDLLFEITRVPDEPTLN